MLHIDSYFSDHMILQRRKPIKISGKTAPQQLVKAVLADQEIETIADRDGGFVLYFEAFEAVRSTDLLIEAGEEKKEYHDVAIGDVYLAAGQSNMEFMMENEVHYEEARKKAKDFRFLIVPPVEYIADGKEVPSFETPEWQIADPDNIQNLSAVSYYAILEIQKYTDIPLGIVGCYKGGTSASCWIDEATLMDQPILKERFYDHYWEDVRHQSDEEEDAKRSAYLEKVQRYLADVDAYQKAYPERSLSQLKHDLGHTPWPGPKGKKDFGRPGGLFETMFSKIKDLSFNAVWWYQGEEDSKSSEYYDILLSTLIDSWRQYLGDLPFFIVQLPNYIEETYPETWPIIRQAQMDMFNSKHDVYVLCMLDCGDDYNIHPTNKKVIGTRLGKQVVQVFYDPNCELAYPYLKEWKRANGAIELAFENIEEGEILLNVDGFEKVYAIQHGSTIVPEAKLTISYAYKNNPKELTKANGLPMYPFYLHVA